MELGIGSTAWTLNYSTYFGGPNQEWVNGMALHTDDGSIYLAGYAYSGMPTTPGAYQTINNTARSKIFVAKFVPDSGSYNLAYSTYIGSGCSVYGDLGAHIAVDPIGDAWITGQTSCRGDTPYFFPTTPDPYIGPPAKPKRFDRYDNVFLTRIRPAGTEKADLIFSTFLSEKFKYYNGCPGAIAIAKDQDPSSNNFRVFVVSRAVEEYGFWNTDNAYSNTFNYANAGDIGKCDVHLLALDQDHEKAYGSFFGGFGTEEPRGLAICGNLVYISGWHAWSDPDPAETAPVHQFPVTNDTFKAVQSGVHPYSSDGFLSVLEIGETATQLRFSTLIGGSLTSTARRVLVDGCGHIYLCGHTGSPDFMTTDGDVFRGGNWDAWALKIVNPLNNVFLSPTSLSATASVPFKIDLTWTDNTGDESGFAIERSEDGLLFAQIDSTTLSTYTDTDQELTANTKYYYRVRAFRTDGWSGYSNIASAVALGETPAGDVYASVDLPVSGSVSGIVKYTWANDQDYQSIEEISSGGVLKNQYSYLEHQWVFSFSTPVAPSALTLHLKAMATDLGNYGESFKFSWSTNGSTFNDLLSVDSATDFGQYQTAPLSGSTPVSAIWIRVVDTNRVKGKNTLNIIYRRSHVPPPELDPAPYPGGDRPGERPFDQGQERGAPRGRHSPLSSPAPYGPAPTRAGCAAPGRSPTAPTPRAAPSPAPEGGPSSARAQSPKPAGPGRSCCR
jgi:hypothetical protein